MSWRQRWQSLSAVGCGLGLLVAFGLCWLVSCPVALFVTGAGGVVAGGVAAGVCWLGTVVALFVAQFLARRKVTPPMAVLAGMGVRMVLPLVVGFVLQQAVPDLATAGLLWYLIIFYQVGLVLETLWFVARLEAADAAKISTGGEHG